MTGNGRLIPNTPIAVDVWRHVKIPHARVFFLSHAHTDHMSGLTKSWSEKLYCSPITAKIVRHKIGVGDEFLQPLSLNEPHVIDLDADGEETMTVTLIDANHCPGAVMFLFEGYFGRILYTGDFRYHPAMFGSDTILGSHLKNVDDLYLDNTYCNPNCDFPSQDQAKEDFLDLVCRNFDKHIVIPTNELGKEDLFEELALTTRTYIQVTPQKLEILRLLDLKDVFTTDPKEERIRLIARKHLNASLAERWDAEHPTIIVIPTALMQGINGRTPYKNMPNVHVIPYSEHSSYSELLQFVERVKPKRLIPIVLYGRGIFNRDCKDRADMSIFDKYLDSRPRMDFVVPESVQKFMNRPSMRMKKPRVVVKKLPVPRPKRRPSLVKKGSITYVTPEKNTVPSQEEKMEVEDQQEETGEVKEGDRNGVVKVEVGEEETSQMEVDCNEDENRNVIQSSGRDSESIKDTKKVEEPIPGKQPVEKFTVEQQDEPVARKTRKQKSVKDIQVHEFSEGGDKKAVIELYLGSESSQGSQDALILDESQPETTPAVTNGVDEDGGGDASQKTTDDLTIDDRTMDDGSELQNGQKMDSSESDRMVSLPRQDSGKSESSAGGDARMTDTVEPASVSGGTHAPVPERVRAERKPTPECNCDLLSNEGILRIIGILSAASSAKSLKMFRERYTKPADSD